MSPTLPNVLVTTDWVAQHATDTGVRVVEVDVDTTAYDQGHVRPARARFFRYFAGQVQMDRAPGRIGFMSTQRREIRWRHTSCTRFTGRFGKSIPGPVARRSFAIASGGTAPPGFPAWFATNSLQSGFRIVQLERLVQLLFVQLVQLVLLVRLVLRHGSPPFGAGLGATAGRPANHGFSLPHIPFPSGLARFHPTLPWVPAG